MFVWFVFSFCFLQYARLLKGTFPSLDSVVHLSSGLKILFQMSVSSTHSINPCEVKKALADLHLLDAPMVPLVFLVPPDVFTRFSPNAADVEALPANVRVQVWEIPLNNAADAKANGVNQTAARYNTRSAAKRKVGHSDSTIHCPGVMSSCE